MLGEVLATSDVPSGVVNLLTGVTAESAAWLASHEDVDALDLTGAAPLPGEDPTLDWGDLDAAAAATLTRVVRPAGTATSEEPAVEPDWTALPDGPRWVLAFMETKTIWHPKGR